MELKIAEMVRPAMCGAVWPFFLWGREKLSDSGKTNRRGGRRADYVNEESMGMVLAALMPANRLAIELAIATGLRIGDILALKATKLFSKGQDGKMRFRGKVTLSEAKTGKNRRVYIPGRFKYPILEQMGKVYVFPHRDDPMRHRTRQAVAKDIMRARKILRAPKDLIVSAHTARKQYGVKVARKGGVQATQRALQHTDESVAAIYALADMITAQKMRGRGEKLYRDT